MFDKSNNSLLFLILRYLKFHDIAKLTETCKEVNSSLSKFLTFPRSLYSAGYKSKIDTLAAQRDQFGDCPDGDSLDLYRIKLDNDIMLMNNVINFGFASNWKKLIAGELPETFVKDFKAASELFSQRNTKQQSGNYL